MRVADGETIIRAEHFKAGIAVWEYWRKSVEWIFGNTNYEGKYYTRKLVFYLKAKGMAGAKKSELFERVFGNNNERRMDMEMACTEARDLGVSTDGCTSAYKR
jgi:hypothetical protein